jgi:prepilin-type N-terminal cleavage/methylation domain-containing protein
MRAHKDEWDRHAARARGEDGFSLPELLVAAMLTLIVAAATLPLLITAMNQTENQSDRVAALDEARNGMVRMSTEIRGAAALVNVSPQILDIMVWDESTGSYHWIRYKCVGNDQGNSQGIGGHCSRQDKTENSGSDCSSTDGTGAGCVVIIRDVVKHEQDPFDEPCDEYQLTGGEKHFCVRDNHTVELSVFVEVPDTYTEDPSRDEIELRTSATIRNCLDQQADPVVCEVPS